MATIQEIRTGILEKGIERAESIKKFQAKVQKFRAEVQKKRKELEEGKRKYRKKFYPKAKK